jgi:hypothetical protein
MRIIGNINAIAAPRAFCKLFRFFFDYHLLNRWDFIRRKRFGCIYVL